MTAEEFERIVRRELDMFAVAVQAAERKAKISEAQETMNNSRAFAAMRIMSAFDKATQQARDTLHGEATIQREMMVEAGQQRPDSIDWMRDGDTRHFYDDVLPMGGDTEPY